MSKFPVYAFALGIVAILLVAFFTVLSVMKELNKPEEPVAGQQPVVEEAAAAPNIYSISKDQTVELPGEKTPSKNDLKPEDFNPIYKRNSKAVPADQLEEELKRRQEQKKWAQDLEERLEKERSEAREEIKATLMRPETKVVSFKPEPKNPQEPERPPLPVDMPGDDDVDGYFPHH